VLALTFPALALSVACALAFSSSDYFRKAATKNCGTPLALFFITLGQIPILAVWWMASGETRLTADYWLPGLLAAACGLAANLFFIAALKRSPLSLMIPLMAMIPPLTTLTGSVMLGEHPTTQQLFGIVLVTVGLFTVYMPAGKTGPRVDVVGAWRNLKREPGTRYMAGVVAMWSLTPPLDKICVAAADVGIHGFIQLALLVTALAAWLLYSGGLRAFAVPKESIKPIAGAAFTTGLAYGLQLAVYQMTMVALVEVFKRVIGLIGSLILGRIFFGEALTSAKMIGVGIMAVGLPLVLLK